MYGCESQKNTKTKSNTPLSKSVLEKDLLWSKDEILAQVSHKHTAIGDIVYYLGNSLNSIIVSPPMVDLDELVDVSCNGFSDGFIKLFSAITLGKLIGCWNNIHSSTKNWSCHKIIEVIWKIVYSDSTNDSYESNLIRRICGLLYISDKDNGIIKAKFLNSEN